MSLKRPLILTIVLGASAALLGSLRADRPRPVVTTPRGDITQLSFSASARNQAPAGLDRLPSAPRAVPAGMLSLAELERMALEHHPLLERAAARVDAARGHALQVGLRPNPRLFIVGDEVGSEGAAGQIGGGISRQILTGGKLARRQAVADQQVVEVEQQWATDRHRVLSDVRTAYYDAVASQRQVILTGQLVGVGQEGIKLTERLRKAELVSDIDVLQAEIETETARIQHEKAKARQRAAWRKLRAVLGEANLAATPLVDDLDEDVPQLTWGESLRRLRKESPEVAVALAAIERAQRVTESAVADSIPNFNLRMNVKHDFADGNTVYDFSVSFPLQINNRNEGEIRRAEALQRAAQSDLERVNLDLQRRLSVVFARYIAARSQANIYSERILPKAQRSLELVTKGYEGSELRYIDLLNAQRTYFRARLVHLEVLQTLRTAAARIESFLLEGSLEAGK